MTELKNCACCGGKAYLLEGYATEAVWEHGTFHRVYCGSCQLRQLFYRTPAEAIAAWNRRAAPAAAPSELHAADEYDELRDTNELRLFMESARLMGWSVDMVPEVSGSAPQFRDPATFAAWWGWRASTRRFRRGLAAASLVAAAGAAPQSTKPE